MIVHNCIQAIARDILCVWMMRADKAGMTIVGHVHDEILTLAPEAGAEDKLEELNEMARRGVSWADGLLLDADGYVSKRYRKD